MLTVENLCVDIAGKNILQNLTVTFPAGRRTAIIGPNGAGKSTLLKAIAGLNSNYTGTIALAGENLRQIGSKNLARRLAILPQGVTALPDVTVMQLVDYGRFPYRGIFRASDPRADREAIEWAMEVTHTTDFADRTVATLSGGERQRAFLAMALAQQPEVLLLDEPTTYLDIAHQLEVMNIVTEVNARYSMTVIMVLHDINHALQYADELVILKDKHIIAQGTPESVLSVDMLARVFGVRADVFTNSQGRRVLSPLEIIAF